MVRVLTELTRAMIIGRLQTGQKQSDVARFFGVSQAAVSKIQQKFVETNDVKNRPRSGRPRVTTPQEDNFLRTQASRNRRHTGYITFLYNQSFFFLISFILHDDVVP